MNACGVLAWIRGERVDQVTYQPVEPRRVFRDAAVLVFEDSAKFETYANVVINDSGLVVFEGSTGPGQTALYRGTDPDRDRIIGAGDALEGKTIETVAIGQHALNERGQIAFTVLFTDGTGAYYRADPESLLPAAEVSGYLLPKKVTLKLDARDHAEGNLAASGTLDSGGKPLDLSGPAAVEVRPLAFDIPGPGKLGGTRYLADGLDLTVTPASTGGSRGTFKLLLTGDLGAIDPDGTLGLHFAQGSVDARCSVPLARGRYKSSTPPDSPPIALLSAKAKLKGAGKDSLALKIGLPGLGPRPGSPPTGRCVFGTGLDETTDPGDFAAKGEKLVSSKGAAKVTLDYGKRLLVLKGKKLDLGSATSLGDTVVIAVTVDGEEHSVSVRMTRSGSSLRY